jgi:hypothetical protein
MRADVRRRPDDDQGTLDPSTIGRPQPDGLEEP